MKHTPEPWKLSKDYYYDRFIHGAYGETRIATGVGEQHEENAKRIVACVNACAGVTTADLVQIAANGGWKNLSVEWKLEAERHADNADSFADRITELEQQRDELLALCKGVSNLIEFIAKNML